MDNVVCTVWAALCSMCPSSVRSVPLLYVCVVQYFMSIIFFQHQAAAHALVSQRSVFFVFAFCLPFCLLFALFTYILSYFSFKSSLSFLTGLTLFDVIIVILLALWCCVECVYAPWIPTCLWACYCFCCCVLHKYFIYSTSWKLVNTPLTMLKGVQRPTNSLLLVVFYPSTIFSFTFKYLQPDWFKKEHTQQLSHCVDWGVSMRE